MRPSVTTDPMHRSRWALAAALVVGVSGCGDPSSSSAPTSPTPPGAATSTSQQGCAATFACPTVEGNVPSFERLTLANGTSATCRADVLRNPSRPTIPVEFTIRNPQAGYVWTFRQDLESAPPFRNRLVSSQPGRGSADVPGPIQATGEFGYLGPSLSSGQTVTQNMVLEIWKPTASEPFPTSAQQVVSTCGVTVWGFVRPGG